MSLTNSTSPTLTAIAPMPDRKEKRACHCHNYFDLLLVFEEESR